MLATKLRAATAAAAVGAWDLAYAYYDPPANLAWNVSTAKVLNDFSVAAQESTTTGLFFKPDGTRVYIVGSTSDSVHEYSLSTAWDITTASFVRSFSVSSRETVPNGIFFKPDGTKMYIIGTTGDDVNEFNLSTAWDISTASYVQIFSIVGQDNNPQDVFFKPDGLKMYVLGSNLDRVYEYDLSTAWNISTASFLQSFSVAAQDATPTGLFFKPDGTKMYVVGQNAAIIIEYGLATAWDVSSASFIRSKSVSTQELSPNAVFFQPNGGMMYVVGSNADAIYMYTVGAFAVDAQENSPEGLFFKTDGTKMYVIGQSGDDVNEYNLSTAWDVGTASFLQNFSIAGQDTAPSDVFFRDDGLRMYVLGNATDNVGEYILSTAWNVSTATYSGSIAVSTQGTSPEGLFFKTDGTKMYIVDSSNETVNEYNLSTAWSIFSASHFQTFSIAAQETAATSLSFKPDGTKMYVLGNAGDDVNEYHLSTAWDISTATYVQNFSIGLQETAPEGLFFNPDGTQMYMIGTRDEVYQYSLGIQE